MDGKDTPAPSDEIQLLIAKGLRAQLVQQSFVTGQLGIQVSMFPGTPAKLVGLNSDITEIPTIPSTFAQIEEAITTITTKLQELDVSRMLADLEATTTTIRDIIAAPELKQAFVNAEETLSETRALVSKINKRFDPLADELTATVRTADSTLIEAKQTLIRGQAGVFECSRIPRAGGDAADDGRPGDQARVAAPFRTGQCVEGGQRGGALPQRPRADP